MRRLVAIENTSGFAVIPCPAGKRIRIMSVIGRLTPSSEPAWVSITYQRSGQDQCLAVSGQLVNSVTAICFFIGADTSVHREESFDPVTGIVSYSQALDRPTAPLPDMAWDYEINLLFQSNATTWNFARIMYEEDVAVTKPG